MPHPDLIQLNAHQMGDWLALWLEQPWDRRREDLRLWAFGAALAGGKDITPDYPYYDAGEWDPDELEESLEWWEQYLTERDGDAAAAKAFCDSMRERYGVQHDHGGENTSPGGSADSGA